MIVTIDTNEIKTIRVCVNILSSSPYSGLIKVLWSDPSDKSHLSRQKAR